MDLLLKGEKVLEKEFIDQVYIIRDVDNIVSTMRQELTKVGEALWKLFFCLAVLGKWEMH